MTTALSLSKTLGMAGLCLGLVLVGCSDGSNTPPSSVNPADEGAVPLPGESISDAVNRIYSDCMDAHGQPAILAESEVNGQRQQVRGYDHSSPLYSAEDDAVCMDLASSLVVAPTEAELDGAYSSTVEIVDCIRALGFDIGVVVSEAEFKNSSGAASMSSNWEAVASQSPPGFSDALDRCFAEFAPSADS